MFYHVAPKVKAICQKHGVPYNQAVGYRDSLAKHLKHTLELANPPLTPCKKIDQTMKFQI